VTLSETVFKQRFLKDIRFWIVFFFVIRLFAITNPPLEVAHNWRQTTVTMVARNFYEVSPDILYPRVDIAGEKSGITGMEFPFLNYLIYLVSQVFGYTHWYGRLINLVISSLGIFYFFRLVKKYFDENIAFYGSIVLLSSIWFAYSRKIMPDTFSMSLTLMGFYFGTNYLEGKSKQIVNLVLYFVLTLIGVISKLPSGFILVLFLLFFADKEISFKSKIIFAVTSALMLVPIVYWYFAWVPYLVERYGFWHFFMGKGFVEGFNEICQHLNDTLAHFYDAALKYIGFAMIVFGIYKSVVDKNKTLLYVLLFSFLTFLVIIFKSGFTFAHHTYYIIPFVPVMALLCGYGITMIVNQKARLLIIVAIVLEGILNQQHDFFLKDKEQAILSLESTMDKYSDRKDLVVINSDEYPTPMYFSHHKGWLASNSQMMDDAFMDDIKIKGCKFAIVLKRSFGTDVKLKYKIIFENESYTLYQL